jgi:hypothetical protein
MEEGVEIGPVFVLLDIARDLESTGSAAWRPLANTEVDRAVDLKRTITQLFAYSCKVISANSRLFYIT